MYTAGKAATSGVPSIYAPSTYAHLSPAKTPPPAAMIAMGPVYNGYSGDFDRNSSGEGCEASSSWGNSLGLEERGLGERGLGMQGFALGGQPLIANLPQLVATAPRYPCFVTWTAALHLVRTNLIRLDMSVREVAGSVFILPN